MNSKFCFIFLIVVFIFASCREAGHKINTDNTEADSLEQKADQISSELKIVLIDSAYTKAIVKSDRGQVFTSENYSLLDGNVKVVFYSKTGRSNVVLTAEEVKIDDITKNMFAKGNVVVVSDSTHTRLETQELSWNNLNKKIHSDVAVTINTPREIINGVGLESDEQLRNYKIFKVTGVMSHE